MVDVRDYRPGVGALLFSSQRLVFVGRRIDAPDAWQLPQGGLKADEPPARAVLRELAEELGTDRAEIVGEVGEWLSYDLPEAIARKMWRGRYRGQRQRWFALRFTGRDADIDLAAGRRPEFDAWRWVPICDLPALAIGFKRALYTRLVAEFAPLVEGGDGSPQSSIAGWPSDMVG
jgi:putative (di)nucleoside polyphosphate hydrolase